MGRCDETVEESRQGCSRACTKFVHSKSAIVCRHVQRDFVFRRDTVFVCEFRDLACLQRVESEVEFKRAERAVKHQIQTGRQDQKHNHQAGLDRCFACAEKSNKSELGQVNARRHLLQSPLVNLSARVNLAQADVEQVVTIASVVQCQADGGKDKRQRRDARVRNCNYQEVRELWEEAAVGDAFHLRIGREFLARRLVPEVLVEKIRKQV
jgi:hypothetical protein